MENNQKEILPIWQAALPVIFLSSLILYGLILRPRFFEQPSFPLEIIFLLAAIFSIIQLLVIGYSWSSIQKSIVNKFAKGLPALLILFSIGLIICTWIISGTIPMLIYFGLKIISPTYIYVLSFFIAMLFSTLTGTSWGSVGTIGAVLIGIASTVDADLGITAGAIIGGAYFGDKMSPLSDTTNLAAIAAEVNLYDHIRSMMNTTVPSAIIAAFIFFIMGFTGAIESSTNVNEDAINTTLNSIAEIFRFNVFLLIPPMIVLFGSIKKKPALPTLLISCVSAIILSIVFQEFSISDIVMTLHSGFDTSMAIWVNNTPENIDVLFNRGGLYELNETIVFTIMVFVFIGAIDRIEAMPRIVNKIFNFADSRSSVILSSLLATAFTNVTTSNQSATSFIIGDAFKQKYDSLKIPRKVLSRSIEDYGTMIESVIPWTATTLFMTATLGVSFSEYWYWQLLSLINLLIAPMLAITGKGCFYNEAQQDSLDEK